MAASAVALLAAIIAGIGLAVGWAQASPTQSAVPDDPERRSVSQSPSQPPPGTVTAGGYLEARDGAQLIPSRAGTVRRVRVRAGERVSRGQVLVELDDSVAVALREEARAELDVARWLVAQARQSARPEAVESAEAELREAQAAHEGARRERQRLEAARAAVAPVDLDKARSLEAQRAARSESAAARVELARAGGRPSEVAEARARYRRAEATLTRFGAEVEQMVLRAPFDGVVLRVDVAVGERIGPEHPNRFVELADLSEIRVRVDVAEQEVSLVAEGERADVIVEAVGPRPLAGEVLRIEPFADRASNTVEVLVRVDGQGLDFLRPGLSARVVIPGTRAGRQNQEEADDE